MNEDNVLDFYNKKRVLITGDTGFKGSWLTKIMCMAGAEVYGFSNGYTESPSLYELIMSAFSSLFWRPVRHNKS